MQSPTAHQRQVGHSMITCLLYKQIIERLALKKLDMSADLKRQLPLVAVASRCQRRVSCIGGSIAYTTSLLWVPCVRMGRWNCDSESGEGQ